MVAAPGKRPDQEPIALRDEREIRGSHAAESAQTAVVMSWSGGKDCALALTVLKKDPRYNVKALLTTVSEEYRRVSHHGVREELLKAQADAIGLPLTKVYLPSGKQTPCTNEIYEEIMATGHGKFPVPGHLRCRLRRSLSRGPAGVARSQPGQGRDDRPLSHLEA